MIIISSPEQEVFKVSLSIGQRPVSSGVRRQQFALNDNFSYTPGPISNKLHRNVAYVTFY